MLKYGRHFLMPSILKVFNHVLKTGDFPKQWITGVITPIYKKKGDQSQPTNYRGITLTSCLGKLFTAILRNSLVIFLDKHNFINPNQFGFRSNSKTTDSIFVLQQLIHKAFDRKEKLHVAFIDYQKDFDSVWHKGQENMRGQRGVLPVMGL